jgi:hypothetical protein
MSLVLLLLSGCGVSMRATAGPTLSSEHRVGLEVGADVGLTLGVREGAAQVVGFTAVANFEHDGTASLMIGYSAAIHYRTRQLGTRAGLALGHMVDEPDAGAFRVDLSAGRMLWGPEPTDECWDSTCVGDFTWLKAGELGITAAWSGWQLDRQLVSWRVAADFFAAYQSFMYPK